MKLDVPTGTTFYYNPYSPKYYTIVQSPSSAATRLTSAPPLVSSSSSSSCLGSSYSHSEDEGSFVGHLSNNSMLMAVEKPQAPSDDVYNLGWSTISSVRQEKTTDAAICTMIQRFPSKTLAAMVAVIETSPNLFLELCENERGNVVSHVIGALQGEKCDELISLTVEHTRRLSMHQSGCIALTRIYDGASGDQQMSIALAMLQHFDELVCHQFGNFVLSRVAQNGDSCMTDFLCAQFESSVMIRRCLNDKFGSHVFEAFVKSCPSSELFRVASTLFSDMDAVMEYATSKIANYPLQNILRQMMTLDASHDLSRWALATIPTLVNDTKFATNINRALGFGRTVLEQSRGQSNNNRSPKSVRSH